MFHNDPQVVFEIQRAHHKEARDAAYAHHLASLARAPRPSLGEQVEAWLVELGRAIPWRPGFRSIECLAAECA